MTNLPPGAPVKFVFNGTELTGTLFATIPPGEWDLSDLDLDFDKLVSTHQFYGFPNGSRLTPSDEQSYLVSVLANGYRPRDLYRVSEVI